VKNQSEGNLKNSSVWSDVERIPEKKNHVNDWQWNRKKVPRLLDHVQECGVCC